MGVPAVGERLEYRLEIAAPYEAVVSVIDDPSLLVESIPEEYVEWRDPEGLHVVIRNPKGLFKFRGEFTASASIKGPGDVVLALNSEGGSVEFRLRADRISDNITELRVEVSSAGIKLKKIGQAINSTVERLGRLIEERARGLEKEVTVAVVQQGSAEKGAQTTLAGEASLKEALETRRNLPYTSKLEDPFFEADVLIRGRPVYSDVIAFTGVADVLELFIDESMKSQLYVKMEFPENFTLKLLMEKGRLLGALAVQNDKVYKDYDAVLEAERRAPAKVTLLVLSI